MFGIFYFPDGTQPHWESVKWLQKEFMQWFNQKTQDYHYFPVESVTLLYKDGKFEDEEMARFVAEEYARGHSFFTYISDSVDSLSSCCRLRVKYRHMSLTLPMATWVKQAVSLLLLSILTELFKIGIMP